MAVPGKKQISKMWVYDADAGAYSMEQIEAALWNDSKYGLVTRKDGRLFGQVYFINRKSAKVVHALLPKATWEKRSKPAEYAGHRWLMLDGPDTETVGEWGDLVSAKPWEYARFAERVKRTGGYYHAPPTAQEKQMQQQIEYDAWRAGEHMS